MGKVPVFIGLLNIKIWLQKKPWDANNTYY